MPSKSHDLTGVDIVTFMMSFAVIAIHCRGTREWPSEIGWVLGAAVPFYFIASGYLLGRKIENDNISEHQQRCMLRERSFRFFRIYAYWLIVYLPLAIYSYIADGTVWWKAIAGYAYKIFFSGHSNGAYQLWFVYSMACVFMIYSFISLSKKKLWMLIAIFASVSVINSCYKSFDLKQFELFWLLTHSTLGGGILHYGRSAYFPLYS